MTKADELVIPFDRIQKNDGPIVGGKNSSLGELYNNLGEKNILVPGGFAITAKSYHLYIESNNIYNELRNLISSYKNNETPLNVTGASIRDLFLKSQIPSELEEKIRSSYASLCESYGDSNLPVAVRSSATAEDLPEASFAGQQESYLNVTGIVNILEACKKCFASLFTDRAIFYREKLGFDHLKIALSIGIQKMVQASDSCSGVMFSIDSDTGFPNTVLINANWGLGESVVKGIVDPDEFLVFKPKAFNEDLVPILRRKCGEKLTKIIQTKEPTTPTRLCSTTRDERKTFCLSDDEILKLGQWAIDIENHYGCPMDIEWAKDSRDKKIYCVQARPETVHSKQNKDLFLHYEIDKKGPTLLTGIAVGEAIATGTVRVLKSPEDIELFQPNDILVTERTDPDWGPIIKKAKAIITDHGGRTSHAAIVSRELSIPAIVGTGDATKQLKTGQKVTVSCAEGSVGKIYEGILNFKTDLIDLNTLEESPVDIMLTLASPDTAFNWWKLPVKGIGLARIEFIIMEQIKIHPLALVNYDQISNPEIKRKIDNITEGFKDKKAYFIQTLAHGIATLAASQFPFQAIVRLSDFKTNEYSKLIGGSIFEGTEENPMLGFRGASRYYSKQYQDAFKMECEAIIYARDVMGLDNIKIMIPFCRTIEEADRVLEALRNNGLTRKEKNLEIYMMAEIPSNALLIRKFAERFDGFSIGSNDLTQLILGVDRDQESLEHLFNEQDEAVKLAITSIIQGSHEMGVKVGICGQAPSDYPEFAEFLVKNNIDSISLNPDRVIATIQHLTRYKHQPNSVPINHVV